MKQITISGARIHNLKNIDVTIPKHKVVVVTGVSGSGKSSLVFDILFQEGKRQYLQSIGMLPAITQEDRFDRITGIGPLIGGLLRSMNIRTFRQIASFTPDDVQLVATALRSSPARIERDNWIGQANELHRRTHGEDI